MSPDTISSPPQLRRFPCVSGDEPLMNAAWWYYVPFSPRERG